MLPAETVHALIEAIYTLDQANNQVSEVIALHEVSSSSFMQLDSACAKVRDAVGLLRSVLDKGR